MEQPEWQLDTRSVVVLRTKRSEKCWVPTQKLLHGSSWLQFSKWDRGFVRFVQGQALNLKSNQGGGTCNVAFLDDLKKRRQEECDQLLAKALEDPAEGVEEGQPRKKRKLAKAKAEVTGKDGAVTPGREMRMLTESIDEAKFWVELTASNLEYIKAACLASESGHSRPRRAKE